MKILIDPVYTGLPSTCSTSYLVWEIINHLCSSSEDVFFYLLYPTKYIDNGIEQSWLASHKNRHRVTIVPKRYDQADRVRELFTFDDELMALSVSGASQYYDVDVILTSRISQLAMYRMTRREETAIGEGTFRQVIGLDEMPVFSFRKTVPWGSRGEVHTLANYLMSDGVVINNLWTWPLLQKVAMKHLSPSRVRELKSKVKQAIPVNLTMPSLKTEMYKDGTDFFLAFTGRITGTRNFTEVADLFRHQFAYPLGKNRDKMKFVVSTNSKSVGSSDVGDVSFVDFQYNNREKFHHFLKHQAHVVVNLSTVEDFSLSTYEPLMFGVPVIVPDEPWADFLGKDYPFRAKDFTQSYALATAFVKDYAGMYARFTKWVETYWANLVMSDINVSTGQVVQKLIEDHQAACLEYIASRGIGGKYKIKAEEVVELNRNKINLAELIEEMDGKLLLELTRTPIMKRPSLSMLKLLLTGRGYVDTKDPGVMIKL